MTATGLLTLVTLGARVYFLRDPEAAVEGAKLLHAAAQEIKDKLKGESK